MGQVHDSAGRAERESTIRKCGAMAAIRIVIVDDHEIARRGIRSVLSGNPDFDVVAEVADGESAIKTVQELRPDVVLLDISLPGISGIDAAKSIRTLAPESRIIFVSQHDSVLVARDALKAGAAGYVVKSDAGRDLPSAIVAASEKRTFVSRTLANRGFSLE